MSLSLVGESFLLLELLFSHMILIFKGIYLTCKGKHTQKSGYIFSGHYHQVCMNFFQYCILSGCKNFILALAKLNGTVFLSSSIKKNRIRRTN